MAPRIHTIGPHEAGKTLLDWMCTRLGLSRVEASRLLQQRKVRLGGNLCSNPAWRLRAGQRVEVPQTEREPIRAKSKKRLTGPVSILRHIDEHLVIVDKPSGLTTMRHAEEAAELGRRGKRFLPTTLADLLPALIAEETGEPRRPVIAVHRIDKETSGLVVFARTKAAESHLGEQFRAHRVERRYHALVRGEANAGRIESSIVRDRGDGRRGSGTGEGQHAITHVEVLETFAGISLVECRLETGRTHQVRIHLGEAGTPLCGERLYDRPVNGKPAPDPSGMKRVALHAVALGLMHPATGKVMRWTSALPDDMARLLAELRRSS